MELRWISSPTIVGCLERATSWIEGNYSFFMAPPCRFECLNSIESAWSDRREPIILGFGAANPMIHTMPPLGSPCVTSVNPWMIHQNWKYLLCRYTQWLLTRLVHSVRTMKNVAPASWIRWPSAHLSSGNKSLLRPHVSSLLFFVLQPAASVLYSFLDLLIFLVPVPCTV